MRYATLIVAAEGRMDVSPPVVDLAEREARRLGRLLALVRESHSVESAFLNAQLLAPSCPIYGTRMRTRSLARQYVDRKCPMQHSHKLNI